MRVRTLGALMVGVLLVPVIVFSQTPPRDQPAAEAPTGIARLRGRVVAADTGTPLRRAQVRAVAGAIRTTRLTSTDAEGGDVTIRYQHNTSPNVKGQFNAGRMPASEYIGLAVKGVRPGEEWDPELRKRIEQYGKRFTLREGEALELEMPYVE